MRGMLLSNELESLHKEIVVALSEILYRHMSGGLRKTKKNLK
jgi:hypothetical protein